MADEVPAVDEAPAPSRPPRRWHRTAGKGLAGLILGVVALIGVALFILDTSIGHRFVVDRIEQLAPKSGLRIKIGRIEGSVYGEAVLRDVSLSDAQGVFARVPVVELDWRPLSWLKSGLDVKKLVLHRGTLQRMPKMNPGDPNAPMLPGFDIIVDDLRVIDLTVAEGVAGPQRKIQLAGKVDIRDGRALVRVNSRLGGAERLYALLDVEPDGDKFDVKVDYAAPKGGLLAQLAGMDTSLALKIDGRGTWTNWTGALLAEREGKRLAALKLGNRAGRYSALGQIWPGDLVKGLPPRMAGQAVSLNAAGTFARRVWDGRIVAATPSVGVVGDGVVDLGHNLFSDFKLGVAVIDPELIQGTRIENGRLAAHLDGGFRDLTIQHWLSVGRVVTGGIKLENVTQSGTASHSEARWELPLNLAIARIVTGDAYADKRLVNAKASGTIRLDGTRVNSDYLNLSMPGLTARLVLTGDIKRGGYGLAGGAGARGFPIPSLGTTDANAKLVFSFAPPNWTLRTNFAGRMVTVQNDTLTTIAGAGIRYSGTVAMGSNRPILIERAQLNASKLSLTMSGRRLANGLTTIAGSGRHTEYGSFTVEASLSGEGPRAVLVFADPLPAAGLKDVRVALSPIAEGFRIETAGGSTLGPFDGVLNLFAKPGGPTRIVVDRLNVSNTTATGALALGDGAASGDLALSGGGVNGTLRLAPRGGGQGFDAMLSANNAKFGGEAPLTISRATLNASGFFAKGHSSVTGSLDAQGVGKGDIYFSTLAAQANVVNGSGRATAQLTGRRGSRFNLQLGADFTPNRVAVLAKGDFAGQNIVMRRRAVLTSEAGVWKLAPTQVEFGGGTAIVSGAFGGGQTALDLALSKMPLSIGNLFVADLGLGGTASGLVEYRQAGRGVPTGNARLQFNGLSRSGLVLTSRPIDVALVADLSASMLQARLVMREGGQQSGRMQARIALTGDGALSDRLRDGRLFAQLRYNGPADALWRLAAIDAFDLSGPFALAADVSGTIVDPQIRGSMSSTTLRLQSALTGTDVSNINAHGTFDGSRLVLSNFTGITAGDGRVSGSGMFDLSDLGRKGLGIDLRLAANKARVLNRADMGATVTGPLRIVSDGQNGTIAGRVSIDTARWQLGRGAAAEELPDIKTREINGLPGAVRPAVRTVWHYLIDANGDNRVNVRGMGLDSEWGADIKLRGTTDAMAIAGRADLVRGAYEFAGKRFELTRGRISFDGGSPPNPRLDVVAELDQDDLDARVNIAGTALRPEITFASTPALPEDELLSQLLFGNSITNISAPEALQLGAALASLRGGGGMDPINKLRSAIGLDRLRIVPADAATGRSTAIAAGKYFGRKFYTEIVTDGKGYNATQLEYRITSWLSLLGTVSSVGHQNINVKASKDY
jgi:translocation and assembly module TamB